MTLAVAIPCGVAAALAYGAATAAQHVQAHTGTGQVDTRGLLALLRNPQWLLAVAGDGVGLALQVIALATGPVVLVQPLLVLAVPVALYLGSLLGGPDPERTDQFAALGIVAGLAVFFVLVGDPGVGRPLAATSASATVGVALIAAALVCLTIRGRPTGVRAAGLGVVAGGFFGVVGVLLNAVATKYTSDGMAGLVHADGLVPLVGVVLLGGLGMVATQASFQVGALAASFPANESTAPLVAVALGAVLLHERLPVSAPHVVGYLGCFAVVVAGTVWLARDRPTRPAQAE
jgi:drug/metabolite transporter (DMT)-like permease